MKNDPLLIFIDAADDAAAYPLSRFLGMTVAADATILMKFVSSIGSLGTDGAAADIVTVTCTADTELTVFKSIAVALAGKVATKEGYLTIADDVNSVYVDTNITGIALALDT
tara:strand:+ start:158 stop:493 length:336 start_codon:yes stop_codon:yes gene_type:complete